MTPIHGTTTNGTNTNGTNTNGSPGASNRSAGPPSQAERILADSEIGIGGSASRSRPSRLSRSAAKSSLRWYSMATATSRRPPEVVVIGAKRGGTTTVWRQLTAHPGMLPLFPAAQKIKGTYYLTDHFGRSERWYRGHFATDRSRTEHEQRLGHPVITGEATPYYLFHPRAPERARIACPDARFVAVLRDPVERAFSHWKERRANGTEPLDFLDALDAETARVGDDHERLVRGSLDVSFAHRHQTYRHQGLYASCIERWSEAVGDRLEVWISEEYHADPLTHLTPLWDRYGLPTPEQIDTRAHNSHPGALPDGARRRLEDAYLDDVRSLESILGRSLSWTDQWANGPREAS